jgi:NAD(P)-dependent dehydrogenase (short-subunit alcohol dehydrogenase family)
LGLGAAFASAIASHNPSTLILTARTPAKALPVLTSLRAANPHSPITYHLIPLDLSSLASVRTAAAQIAALAPSIDVLINNAGVMALPSRTLSVDGVEMHLASNFLGHFLLTTLLAAQLRAGGGARVVNVTSAGFVLTPFRFADFNFDEGRKDELPASERVNVPVAEAMGLRGLDASCGYVPMIAYAQANTANMLFTRWLGEVQEGVVGVSAAPGGEFHHPLGCSIYTRCGVASLCRG